MREAQIQLVVAANEAEIESAAAVPPHEEKGSA
jgi:hypothetical protein